MRRREFIAGLVAAAWPVVVRALAQERVRRIGLLMNLAEDGAEAQARLAAFAQALQQRGWTVGRNVQIDTRWGEGDPDRYRQYAAELINREPDVVMTSGGSAVSALQ